MAIYSMFGSKVNFKSARLVPVWIEETGHEIKWHYTEPKLRKRSSVEKRHIWHAVAEYAEDYGNVKAGDPIYGGREEQVMSFRANEGILEIINECYRLNPTDAQIDKDIIAGIASL